MKQTNYQLFDFLDFDVNLDGGERLWKACLPTDIREVDGDIFLTIPFQKQCNSNEIKPDFSEPRKIIPLEYGHWDQRFYVYP